MQIKNKYTKELNNPFTKISKDTLIYVPAYLIPAFINVFSIVIFTRIFEASAYGEYSLVLTTTTFLAILLSEWITQSIQRYLPQNKTNEEQEIFFSYLRFLIFTLIAAIVAISIVFFPVIKPNLDGFAPYYWPSVFLIILNILFAVSGGIFQSELKSKEFSIYRILNVSFRLLISLSLIYILGREIIGLIWGAVITFCLILIPMLRKNRLLKLNGLEIRRQLNAYKHYFFQFIAYGFPLIGWYIGTSILDISDRYLLNILGTSKDVGIYSANYNLISASLGLVTAPLLTATQPVIMNMAEKASDDLDKIKNLISKLSRIYILVVMPFIVYVAVFREDITFLLLGKDFREGAVIIPILLMAFSLWNFTMYGQIGHLIKEKTHILLVYVSITAGVNILMNFILIPPLGYKGAALSTLISFLLYPLFIYYSSKKYIAWEIRWGSLWKIVLISTFTGFVVGQFRNLALVSVHPLFALALCFFMGIGMYLILLIGVKELDQKEKKLLKKVLLYKIKQNQSQRGE